jgi:hypothetical protein
MDWTSFGTPLLTFLRINNSVLVTSIGSECRTPSYGNSGTQSSSMATATIVTNQRFGPTWIEDGLDLARNVVLDVRNAGILGVECLGRVRLASSFASESCSSSYATLYSRFPFCAGTLGRHTLPHVDSFSFLPSLSPAPIVCYSLPRPLPQFLSGMYKPSPLSHFLGFVSSSQSLVSMISPLLPSFPPPREVCFHPLCISSIYSALASLVRYSSPFFVHRIKPPFTGPDPPPSSIHSFSPYLTEMTSGSCCSTQRLCKHLRIGSASDLPNKPGLVRGSQ